MEISWSVQPNMILTHIRRQRKGKIIDVRTIEDRPQGKLLSKTLMLKITLLWEDIRNKSVAGSMGGRDERLCV